MTEMRLPKPGDLWAHYKGGRYVITCLGFDATSGDPVVVYQSVDHPPTSWVRPLGEFLGYSEDRERRFELLVTT